MNPSGSLELQFDRENVEEFFENLSECVLRHTFTANEMHHLGMNGNEIFIVSPKAVCAK
jgi:hypothetical protein